MKSDAIAYFLLTGPKRWRVRLAKRLRGTAVGRVLRPVYRACAPLVANPVTSVLSGALRRRLYRMNPRSYWQREGGRKYLEDEAFLLGPGSMSEKQGRFLAAEIQDLGAKNVLEAGCGYGRMLRELSRNLGGRLCGADFSESQLIAGREYMAPAVIPLVLADATQGLPFRSASFDLVYTQGCLMHVPTPQNRAFQNELARVSRRYVVHTEEFADSVHTFAHDVEDHYRILGYRLLKKIPYPLSPPGQKLTFQVFEKQKTGLHA
jgi:SAM-dependent methyltransferase